MDIGGVSSESTQVNVMAQQNYKDFLNYKSQLGSFDGFEPVWIPDFLFDFQKVLVDWAIRKGRAAIFADCGLGKTPMQLVWAENVIRKTNKKVIILTPLAVSYQTVEEGNKFGIDCKRMQSGEVHSGITVTNYERLHYFNPSDFIGCVCDESSILKSFNGVRKREITEFMKKMPYRLLATATAAPNDYTELGTSSEALGELGYIDMLNRFFKNENNSSSMRKTHGGLKMEWRLKGHAEIPFWRWVCSWARALRKPSDLNLEDNGFKLPPLIEKNHNVEITKPPDGMLFYLPAIGLKEQRDERRRSIQERCERVASLVNKTEKPALIWCHLNSEGDLLERIIKDGKQVSGRDTDDSKEEKLMAFAHGNLRILITKPKIAGWGLNFQHCSHVTFFPSHSFEQYYQGVRRCWRFGQKNPVQVDIVSTEGEKYVMANLQRKSEQADQMFSRLVEQMHNVIRIERDDSFPEKEEVPTWL